MYSYIHKTKTRYESENHTTFCMWWATNTNTTPYKSVYELEFALSFLSCVVYYMLYWGCGLYLFRTKVACTITFCIFVCSISSFVVSGRSLLSLMCGVYYMLYMGCGIFVSNTIYMCDYIFIFVCSISSFVVSGRKGNDVQSCLV